MQPDDFNKSDLHDPSLEMETDADASAASDDLDQDLAPASMSDAMADEVSSSTAMDVDPASFEMEYSPVNTSALKEEASPEPGHTSNDKVMSGRPTYLDSAAKLWKRNYDKRTPEQRARDIDHKREVDEVAAKTRHLAFPPRKNQSFSTNINTADSTPFQGSQGSYHIPEDNDAGDQDGFRVFDDIDPITDLADPITDLADPDAEWAIRDWYEIKSSALPDIPSISQSSPIPQQHASFGRKKLTRKKRSRHSSYIGSTTTQSSTDLNDSVSSPIFLPPCSSVSSTPAPNWLSDIGSWDEFPSPFLRPWEKDNDISEIRLDADNDDSDSDWDARMDAIADSAIEAAKAKRRAFGGESGTKANQRPSGGESATKSSQRSSGGESVASTPDSASSEKQKKPRRDRRRPWDDREKNACRHAMEWALKNLQDVKVEDRWNYMSSHLAEVYDVHRTGAAIKDQWNRYLRSAFDLDERIKPKPHRMATCVQPTVGGKRKRQSDVTAPSPTTDGYLTPGLPASKMPKVTRDGPRPLPKLAPKQAPRRRRATPSSHLQPSPSTTSPATPVLPSIEHTSSPAMPNAPPASPSTHRSLRVIGQTVADTFQTTTGKPLPSTWERILHDTVAMYAPAIAAQSAATTPAPTYPDPTATFETPTPYYLTTPAPDAMNAGTPYNTAPAFTTPAPAPSMYTIPPSNTSLHPTMTAAAAEAAAATTAAAGAHTNNGTPSQAQAPNSGTLGESPNNDTLSGRGRGRGRGGRGGGRRRKKGETPFEYTLEYLQQDPGFRGRGKSFLCD